MGLLCTWVWLTAFIIWRVYDKVLGGCWFVLCVIQGSSESAENYRENSTLPSAHNVSSRVSEESNGTSSSVSELHWLDYFENPGNRSSWQNPKASDFKHKRSRQAMWIDSWTTPSWVRVRFE